MKFLLIIVNISLLIALTGCSKSSDISLQVSAGKGGSMARFAINGNYLYTVDSQNLRVFDVTASDDPVYKTKTFLGFDIETIFPYGQNIFIGTQTGMKILSVQNPLIPQFLSTYEHIRTCDPVVVQDSLAYVTLRAGRTCGTAFLNQLEVISIKNLQSPQIIKTYQLTSPYGLGIDGNKLFVCDGVAGLRIFNLDTPTNLTQVGQYNIPNAYDVIPLNNLLIMSAEDGIYQCNYSQSNYQVSFLSKISVER